MRRIALGALGAVLATMLLAGGTFAHGGTHGQGGSGFPGNACGRGRLVINVVHKVVNDLDAGFQGGWAYDTYLRHIRVRRTGADTYCATVSYRGTFVTIPGQLSPADGSTTVLTRAVKGTFKGGYFTNQFSGTLNPDPAYSRHGWIGTFDYACDLDFNCNYFSWPDSYFSSLSGQDLAWWGWTYRYRHQRWVNTIDGTSGDITG